MVSRPFSALLFAVLVLASCRNDIQNKAKVQEAIVERLRTSSGLDLKNLDITTTSVTFDKKIAYATVAFHPKDDPSVNHGMEMKYTLQDRGGKWQVIKVGDSQGHGLGGGHNPASGDPPLPPGHPSVDAPAAPGSNGQAQ